MSMSEVCIIGKQPCVDIVLKSLNESVEVRSTIIWDESLRIGNKDIVIKTGDIIILAFFNKDLAALLRQWILCEYSFIRNGDIVDFISLRDNILPPMWVDRLFCYNLPCDYEGLIMGLSHARVGICQELIPIRVANMAISAQDIFYNYASIEYIVSKYRKRLEKLKYIVYDVFDYTYLNYDVSMSSNALQYYEWGGFSLDKHNLLKNKNIDLEFAVNVFKGTVSNRDKRIEKLCDEYFDKGLFVFFSNLVEDEIVRNRCRVVSEKEVSEYDGDNSLVNKRFPKTIEENIVVLEKTIKLLLDINPNMIIKLFIFPHYIPACERIKKKYEEVQIEFTDVMNKMINKYDVEFYDLKESESFNNMIYFYDCEHLNYFGARRFTTILNKIMGW